MPNVLEQAAVKAAGKLGALEAVISGLDGVFRQLTEEHKEVAILLARAAMSSDPEKRADLWAKLRQELTTHEHAELQVVYPELVTHPALGDVVSQHDSEAAQLEVFIRDVDMAPISSIQWQANLKKLQEAVTSHAAREEKSGDVARLGTRRATCAITSHVHLV